MAKALFKKVVRTKATGSCKGFGGATWTEKVRSTKASNKAFRKVKIA